MQLVKPRPVVVHGATYRQATPVGTAFITINTNGEGEPLEVFVNVGKAGTDIYAVAEGLGRVISLALRFSSHLNPHERVKEIIGQLSGIGGARATGFGKERVRSLPDAVARVLSMHFELNGHAKKVETPAAQINDVKESAPQLVSNVSQPALAPAREQSAVFDICPSCGEALLAHEEGCSKCYGCGYSAC